VQPGTPAQEAANQKPSPESDFEFSNGTITKAPRHGEERKMTKEERKK
jgi:hypothetical protein